jgi:integrase
MRKASGRNQVMAKLRKIFDVAVEMRDHRARPGPLHQEREGGPARGNPPYNDDEILLIVEAAVREGPEAFAILLLMMDTDLRVSEVCALRWSDVDLKAGVITIRHNFSKGKPSPPKGKKVKPVGITPALDSVLRVLPRVNEFVLVRSDIGARPTAGPPTPSPAC